MSETGAVEGNTQLPAGWDWADPDYGAIVRMRSTRLDYLRARPGAIAAAKAYYADDHYVEFIRDLGWMRDPRLAASGKPTIMPFVPFPRQVELLHWIHDLVKAPAEGRVGRGNVEKTRDCGFSWCCVAYACWRFVFFSNNDIGFGSSLERNVYDLGNPKSIFFKIQAFLDLLPEEFQPQGWLSKRHINKGAAAGKATNPENGSTITGDCGDDIGRSGRTLIYFVDEHSFIDRPQMAEAGLSENTNTQINGSTHSAPDTIFFRQCASLRSNAPERLFEFDWHDDPRKDDEWYRKKKNDPLTDPIIFAREIDRDPSAAIADGFIAPESFESAMLGKPLDVIPSGPYIISVDVADMGRDQSVITTRRGDLVLPLIKLRKKEGDQLAGEVERHCRKLLEGQLAPLGAIIYELAGPGYGLHVSLKSGPFSKLRRPINPGARLASAEYYNVRAQFWGLFKEWLEDGAPKKLPRDKALKELGSSIRYSWREGRNGTRTLLMESKKEFRARLAADPKQRASGPSPDEADGVAMTLSPVRLGRMVLTDLRSVGVLPDDIFPQTTSWGSLDPVAGY